MKAKTTIELVRPTAALESSYRGHVAEFVDRVEPLIPFPIGFDPSDFSALLKKLDDCSRGVGIPEGLAAHSTFWLVRDGTEVVVYRASATSSLPNCSAKEAILATGFARAPGDRDWEQKSSGGPWIGLRQSG